MRVALGADGELFRRVLLQTLALPTPTSQRLPPPTVAEIIPHTLERKHDVACIMTRLGKVQVFLYDATPKHKRAFLQLSADGYWTDYAFNRVIPGFVAQAGCPDVPEVRALRWLRLAVLCVACIDTTGPFDDNR